MRNKQLTLLFIIFILASCRNENNFIVVTDFNLLIPDSTQMSKGITENQQQKLTEKFFNILRENTLNHEIPDVTIFDLNGTTQRLKEHLLNKRLIISTSLTCAWNMEGFLNDFPKANQLIKNPISENEIILLILREKTEYFNRQFEENITEIKNRYSNIFIIDSLQSARLNIFGLTRYYISKEQIVLDMGNGTSEIEFLKYELEKNTVANIIGFKAQLSQKNQVAK